MIHDFKIYETDKEAFNEEVWVQSFQFTLHDGEGLFCSYFLEYKGEENLMEISKSYKEKRDDTFYRPFSSEEREEIKKIILNQPQYRLRNLMEEYKFLL